MEGRPSWAAFSGIGSYRGRSQALTKRCKSRYRNCGAIACHNFGVITMETIVKNIIQPLSTRLGTAAAGLVVGWGASIETADHVAIAVQVTAVAVAFVIVDLFTARAARKRIQREAVNNG